MQKRLTRILVVVAGVVVATQPSILASGITPIQVSIWSPVQVFPADWDVIGLRLNGFYGRNSRVYGLDVGLYNHVSVSGGGGALGFNNTACDGNALEATILGERAGRCQRYYRSGYGCGVFGVPSCSYCGLQAGMFNYADRLRGVQCAILGNQAADMKGIQLSLLANVAGNSAGLQCSFGNTAWGNMSGVQVGCAFNFCAGTMRGMQVSLLNYARTLHGVQIGIANIVKDSPVPFSPFLNAHF